MSESGKSIPRMPNGQVCTSSPYTLYAFLRHQAKEIRRNLMARDEFKNLGFADDDAKDTRVDGKSENKEILW